MESHLTWSALEYEEKDRHPDWIWCAGLVFGIAAIVSFFYGNIFFGIFLVIAGVCVILFASRKPNTFTLTIDEKELVVDDTRYPYERLTQFWIDETEKPDKLLVLIKGSVMPMLAFPLAGVTAEAVRTEMKKHLPEVAMRESMSIKIAERLGF